MTASVFLSFVATIYGVGGATSALLQARQMRRAGGSGEVSVAFLAIHAGGYAVWLAYGLSIRSAPLVIVDAVGLVCVGLTLVVALRLRGSFLRRSIRRSRDADRPELRRWDDGAHDAGTTRHVHAHPTTPLSTQET